MSNPFLLFHWSPGERRKQILRYGLRPGCLSRCGIWKPPYICFSASPSQAWGLIRQERGDIMDLWMMWSNVPSGYEVLYHDRTKKPKEYRIYERIFKRDVWYVGTREYKPRKIKERNR